jgi:SAM-dependent methyltransferase
MIDFGRRAYLACLLATAAPATLISQQAPGAPAVPRRAPDVHFVPTEAAMVRAMLRVAQVGNKDVVYDLGCGDGRIVIAAVKQYQAARGVCVDIDPVRIAESKRNADTAGVSKRIRFHEGDLFEMDLRDATVVTLYLLPALNERLRPKLFRELRPGTRIVSNSFDMGDWKADSVLKANPASQFFNYAYFWVIPADVAGSWKITLKGSEASEGEAETSYNLEVEQRYQHLSGTASAGQRKVGIEELSVRGDRLKFVLSDSVAGKPRELRFTGRVTDGRAQGTVKGLPGVRSWSAVRTERGPRPEIQPKDTAGAE